ncbi:UNVERIFIED_CONTAM: hypothetical protein FKN15_024801 [Acipenser sinensis]
MPEDNTDLMAPLQNRRHPIGNRGCWCAVNRGFPCRLSPSLPGCRPLRTPGNGWL